jgi:choloylglycine hydrolase
MIRNASVPLGISTAGQPNISSTRWRTVADHKDRRYYYDSVLSPSVLWVDLDDVEFAAGTPVRRLDLAATHVAGGGGDVTAEFSESAPFPFAPVEPTVRAP